MNDLGKCLVEAVQQDDEFRVIAREVLQRRGAQGALFIDRMHDGPLQWEKCHARPFQRQFVEYPAALVATLDQSAEDYGGLNIHELAVRIIDDAELEGRDAVIRGDDGLTAEQDPGDGPGEAGEDQSGGHGEENQAGQRLQHDDHVGGQALRAEAAVTDGGEGSAR